MIAANTNGLIEYRNNSTAFASFLRRGNVVKYTRFTNEDVLNLVPEIDASFYTINKDLILYRGVDSKYNIFNKSINNLNIGDILTDLSFVSTSTSKEVAKEFSYNNSPIFIINFKRGSKAIIMDGIGGEYHDYQNEILLERGSKFIVRHISKEEITIDLV